MRPDTNLIIKTASRKIAGQSKNSNSAAFKLKTVAVAVIYLYRAEGNDLRSRSPLYLLCINWRDLRVAYLSGTTNKENFGFKNVLDCVF